MTELRIPLKVRMAMNIEITLMWVSHIIFKMSNPFSKIVMRWAKSITDGESR